MRLLLCQVCGGPADRHEEGVLWLVGEDQAETGVVAGPAADRASSGV